MLDILTCTVGGVGMSNEAYVIIPKITVMVVNVIKIVIPIMLIIFGMLDLAKAVMTNDEKEMKGAQTKLMKRAIYAVLVFLVIAIVQLLFGALAGSADSDSVDGSTIQGCISCFVSQTKDC
ncbi:MAG: hypothetical protein PHN42_03970 [Bacilli bacterium]|nr:hypothetical protein [Bacilli bacterium]